MPRVLNFLPEKLLKYYVVQLWEPTSTDTKPQKATFLF